MSSPSPTAVSTSRDSTEARIALLRAQLELAEDRALKAAIQYEIGHLTETELHIEAQAVREYLSAFNLDPSFRPPLYALVRIFERRRSFKNLSRLYEAEQKAASSPEEQASALVDLAVLAEDHLSAASGVIAPAGGGPEVARAHLEEAMRVHPDGLALPAWMLERLLIKEGDAAGAAEVIAARAEAVGDPALRGMLWTEVAKAREEAGDIEGALHAAKAAATSPASRYRFLERLERIARRHGRLSDVVRALEQRAALVASAARGEETQGSGAFSVKRFADQQRATHEAAALHHEAARILLSNAGAVDPNAPDPAADAQRALVLIDRALELRPDDLALVRERMLACELAGDLAGASLSARRLLDAIASAPPRLGAPLHFRMAEEAQLRGDFESARASLEASQAADPGSALVAAMLEDLALGTGYVDAWADRLAQQASQEEGVPRAWTVWRAAHLVATRLGDAERAAGLYRMAVEAARASEGEGDRALSPVAIAREWLGASLRLGSPGSAREAARALLGSSIEDAERSAVLRDLHEIERLVLEDHAAADATLAEALDSPAAGAWAPEIARLHGAATGNVALLARGHRMLAERSGESETAAAHLCAGARALIGGNDLDGAVALLQAALQRSPAHRYAVALLEEVYRARGDADAVVKLLRQSAEADRAGQAVEGQLLLAGAAAEAAGNVDVAISTYEEAAQRDPSSMGPLFALRRLAEARNDDALMMRVLERLSEREDGAGWATVELAEHLQLVVRSGELSEPLLRSVLERAGAGEAAAEVIAAAAVTMHALGPSSPVAHHEAAQAILRASVEAPRASSGAQAPAGVSASGAPAPNPGLARELGGILLDVLRDSAAVEPLARQVLEATGDDPWALVALLRATWRDPSRSKERADAILALADGTQDPQVSAELIVHGLRAAAFAGLATDDAVLRASDLEAAMPGSFPAAVAGAEALGEADDPGERADALGRWLVHASPESARSVRAAQGRALAGSGRGSDAVAALKGILEQSPDDLASWEALRVAARDAEAWEDLVAACDRLAAVVDGELRAQLLEEAAAVLMDHLDADDEAERRLREALAIEGSAEGLPSRKIAYERLLDILAERGDERGRLALVSARADRTDDPDQLAPLLYEVARLHRSIGQRQEALTAIDNLLMLEPEHVGGLALLVELQVQREAWPEAVQALRVLASARDVPDSQRRIARLGAAEFLEKKLGDLTAALTELRAVESLGLADRALFERMADLAERGGSAPLAVEFLQKAAHAAKDPLQVAAIERRAGRLLEKTGELDEAISAYRKALRASPTDVGTGRALAALLDPEGRVDLSHQFEESVRARLGPLSQPPGAPPAGIIEPDLLRALSAAGEWRGDRVLTSAVLGALVALDVANQDERDALHDDTHVVRRINASSSRLGDQRLAQIRAPSATGALEGPLLELALLTCEALLEIDKTEPSAFGIGRNDLVSPKTAPPIALDLTSLAALMGAPAGDVYIGGKDPNLLTVIPSHRGKPAWIVGPAVRAPLSTPLAFEAGRAVLALRMGLGPFLSRGVEGSATAMYAMAAAAGAALPAGEGRAGMAEATRAAGRSMPRKVKRALPEVVGRINDGGRSVLAMSASLHATFARGGLLVAGDVVGVLEIVLGRRPDQASVLADPRALDLLRFWMSPLAMLSRRELGLAS